MSHPDRKAKDLRFHGILFRIATKGGYGDRFYQVASSVAVTQRILTGERNGLAIPDLKVDLSAVSLVPKLRVGEFINSHQINGAHFRAPPITMASHTTLSSR
jgi:hypothetical protein